MNVFTRRLDRWRINRRMRSLRDEPKHVDSVSLISGAPVVSVVNGQLTPAGKQQLDYAERILNGSITPAPMHLGGYVPSLDEVRRTRDEIMAQVGV